MSMSPQSKPYFDDLEEPKIEDDDDLNMSVISYNDRGSP